MRQLAVSVLFDLQRRDPEPGVGGAAGRGQRADRGASLPNSESQQLDLLERLRGRGNDLHANFCMSLKNENPATCFLRLAAQPDECK